MARKRKRLTAEEKMERAEEALSRARDSNAWGNYPAVYAGLMAKGIDADDIDPRENVLTFAAWPALGRHVRKGEHGVKILTWIKGDSEETTNPETGAVEVTAAPSYPKTTTVFHISQTDPDQVAELAAV